MIFLSVGSLSVILIFNGINHYPYFKGDGEIFNLILYMILVVILVYRHYNVTIKEARAQDRLEQLTYYDDLTHDGGQNYKSTFHVADQNMYENKLAIKAEYKMKGR